MFVYVKIKWYLCSVPFSHEEVSECNLFNRGGPSRLHPALYFFIRVPIFFSDNICLCQMLFIHLYYGKYTYDFILFDGLSYHSYWGFNYDP